MHFQTEFKAVILRFRLRSGGGLKANANVRCSSLAHFKAHSELIMSDNCTFLLGVTAAEAPANSASENQLTKIIRLSRHFRQLHSLLRKNCSA